MVVTGRDDRIVGYADQFNVLASYPLATYVALSSAGHYLPLEQPEAFWSLVRDWLARCSSAAH